MNYALLLIQHHYHHLMGLIFPVLNSSIPEISLIVQAQSKKTQHLCLSGTISNLQIFFGKLTNCQTTFCQPSFYPPFILPNFFCANLQFTKYILPNLHFLDFWKTYKFPSFCQTYILPNLHFAKPFSL